jgi:hypothetical protein
MVHAFQSAQPIVYHALNHTHALSVMWDIDYHRTSVLHAYLTAKSVITPTVINACQGISMELEFAQYYLHPLLSPLPSPLQLACLTASHVMVITQSVLSVHPHSILPAQILSAIPPALKPPPYFIPPLYFQHTFCSRLVPPSCSCSVLRIVPSILSSITSHVLVSVPIIIQ